MRTVGLALVACLCLSGRVFGQGAAYNPYAPAEKDAPPIAADGELNWPTFYKSSALRQRFQSYFDIGACVGTNRDVNERLNNNRVDINKLGEQAVQGRAISRMPQMVTIANGYGKKTVVVTHPAGVSKVKVGGSMSIGDVRPQMTVRFVARVNKLGEGISPLESLEVITPEADFRWREIEPGRMTTMTARVVEVSNRRVKLQVPTGKLRRLSFLLDDETTVIANASSLDLVSPGDAVKAKGHVFSGEGVPSGTQIVFASEVTVDKSRMSAQDQRVRD